MKRIFASLNLVDVHHAKNLLESIGIRSCVRNESLSSAIGQLPFTDCQPELWLVDDADVERAGLLLSEGLLKPVQESGLWQCRCGEICEAQFTQCWRCTDYRQR
ncbi:MAG: DUF2007 domain-containing protein [Betaproteobacteria bacterium]|nr:DUF2007 domain-containing protein [Betaproteobacteria bacterium]